MGWLGTAQYMYDSKKLISTGLGALCWLTSWLTAVTLLISFPPEWGGLTYIGYNILSQYWGRLALATEVHRDQTFKNLVVAPSVARERGKRWGSAGRLQGQPDGGPNGRIAQELVGVSGKVTAQRPRCSVRIISTVTSSMSVQEWWWFEYLLTYVMCFMLVQLLHCFFRSDNKGNRR